ncbi:PREDICTED: uncharacterized protein LOC106815967 [Priapulus caudatus]|uniref:Uncharacterized protein LOC106815967 n=1 Tax=Priapulus caudatus TaxID=37621 RepID=A0ABM1EUW9_PRICU|nr:PREDICTED: uncharacterized protein LOC106815967 [Priapulus caudatus]
MGYKRNFEYKVASNIKSDPKSFWKYVRGRTSTKDSIGPLTDDSGTVITDNKHMAMKLNDYFVSVFTVENTLNIPVPIRKTPQGENTVLDHVIISQEAVKTKCLNLKPDKAPGGDKIPPRVLKEAADTICEPLHMIFQHSLVNSYIPEDWKDANVTPIFKKGPRDRPCNYRPVSLTSVACKIMEALYIDDIDDTVTSSLSKFADDTKLFGSVSAKSTSYKAI